MKKLVFLLVGFVLGGLSVYLYCCNQFQEDKGVLIPKGLITSKQAKELDLAFDARHKLISDSILKRPDNRSSWFALKEIKAYLDYAEHYSDSIGYKMDGVRVYLGAYASVSGEEGYTTMFLVPTGTENISEGNMLNRSVQSTKNDLKDVPAFNNGEEGQPPSANYPQ